MFRLLWLLAALVFSSSALGQTATTIPNLQSEFPVNGCASVGKAQPCINEKNWLDIIATFAGRTSVSVTDYGTKGDGVTDDTQAIIAADAAAAAAGSALWFPPGKTFAVCGNNGVTVLTANATWISFGQPATIKFKCDIGAGVRFNNVSAGFPVADGTAAGLVLNTNAIYNLILLGPGCTALGSCNFSVGVPPSQMDGLRLGLSNGAAFNPMFVEHVQIQGFYNGLVVNTQFGHWHILNSQIKNNFYNLYLVHTGGDAIMRGNDFTGADMASLACAWNNACLLGNFELTSTHLGFAPYGIYQEPSIGAPTFGGFASGGALSHVAFECIGNAAIKSAQAQNGEQLWAGNIITKHGGFSWSANGTFCPAGNPYEFSTSNQTKTCTVNAANNPGSGTYNGSGLLTSCATTPKFTFGQAISGTGIAATSFVLSDDGAGNVRISLPVTGTNGAETVTAAFDANYAIDLGDLEGVFDIDMGAAPMDVNNGAGAFEPGSTGSIIHTQACSSVTGQNGSHVILRYSGQEEPPHANSQVALYVCDSDPFSSASAALSRVLYTGGFSGGPPNYYGGLLQLAVASGQTSGSMTFQVSNVAAGGSVLGLQPVCMSASDSIHAVAEAVITQGSGSTKNVATLTVTLAAAAPGGGETVNCLLPPVF